MSNHPKISEDVKSVQFYSIFPDFLKFLPNMTAQLATQLCGGLGGTRCLLKAFGRAEVENPDD